MSRIIQIFSTSVIAISLLISCSGEDGKEVHVSLDAFPGAVELAGDTLRLPSDSIFVPGAIAPVDGGYLVFLYDNPCFLAAVDSSFTSMSMLAPKGEGPGELSGVSSFGQPVGQDGEVAIYDPYSQTMYSCRPFVSPELNLLERLPESASSYSSGRILRLNSGKYVTPRGDFRYGMIAFAPSDTAVTEWPLGIAVNDPEHPKSNHMSLRGIAYEPDRGVVAEIYGGIPSVILHDENGDIVRVITLDELRRDDPEADCINKVCLTRDRIWMLYGDDDIDSDYTVFVTDYEGTPIGRIRINPTSTMEIDEARGQLLTVDPNNDEANIVAYPIPDAILGNQH